eukprot:scaffold173526_cov35-Tisochrysis_lutea.AAC.1
MTAQAHHLFVCVTELGRHDGIELSLSPLATPEDGPLEQGGEIILACLRDESLYPSLLFPRP